MEIDNVTPLNTDNTKQRKRKRTKFTKEMKTDHASYKAKVEAIPAAKKRRIESRQVAENSKNADLVTQRKAWEQVRVDTVAWRSTAIE